MTFDIGGKEETKMWTQFIRRLHHCIGDFSDLAMMLAKFMVVMDAFKKDMILAKSMIVNETLKRDMMIAKSMIINEALKRDMAVGNGESA